MERGGGRGGLLNILYEYKVPEHTHTHKSACLYIK